MNEKYDFKGYVTPRAFDGIKELIEYLKCTRLQLAVLQKKMSKFSSTELEKNNFDVIITTDDIDKGKPDHTAFITALSRMKTETSEAIIVVQNARYE